MKFFGKSNTSFVRISGNNVRVNAKTVPEAKLALKELKLHKKDYALAKRQINEQQKAIRAAYTDEIRRRGSKFQGGGGVGRFIRIVQTAKRDGARKELAKKLEPLEVKKRQVEAIITAIDQTALQIEAHILKNS